MSSGCTKSTSNLETIESSIEKLGRINTREQTTDGAVCGKHRFI